MIDYAGGETDNPVYWPMQASRRRRKPIVLRHCYSRACLSLPEIEEQNTCPTGGLNEDACALHERAHNEARRVLLGWKSRARRALGNLVQLLSWPGRLHFPGQEDGSSVESVRSARAGSSTQLTRGCDPQPAVF